MHPWDAASSELSTSSPDISPTRPLLASDPVSDSRTTADLLAASLRALGVRRAFRASGCELPPLEGIDELAVSSQAIAVALADSEGVLARSPHAHPGVSLLPGNVVRISTTPGGHPPAVTVDEPSDLVMVVAGWALGAIAGVTDLIVDIDPAAPVPDDVQPVDLTTSADRLTRLSPSLAGFRTVLVLGAGVARAGEGAGAIEAANAIGAGIVCTPSAEAVVPADHPRMLGVVGLQARDAELTGLADAELVIAAGVDGTEVVPVPDTAQVLGVEPWHLPLMASHWETAGEVPERSALRVALAELITGERRADGGPAEPWRVLDVLASHLPPGAVVAAEPGIAGLWLARGLPFATLAADPSAALRRVVPTPPPKGIAAATAFVSALDGRPAVALLDDLPLEPTTESILQMADALDLPVVTLTWTADSSTGADIDDLPVLLRGGRGRSRVAVDLDRTDDLLALAGPVTAWLTDT
jgi:hypothetical protein